MASPAAQFPSEADETSVQVRTETLDAERTPSPAANDRGIILASDLPPAADALEALFSEDSTPVEAEEIPEPVAELPKYPAAGLPADSLSAASDLLPAELDSAEAESEEEDLLEEGLLEESAVEISVHENVSPGFEPASETATSLHTSDISSANGSSTNNGSTDDAALEETAVENESPGARNAQPISPEAIVAEAPLSISYATAAAEPLSSEPALDENLEEKSRDNAPTAIVPSSDWAFEEKLASHREWIESRGVTGSKANWPNASLEERELIGVNLRFADLHAANLRGADLLLADMRDTCLVRANLQDACLVGTNFEGANLEGASLASSMGLVARQLAGANLRDASLPAEISEFAALAEFQRACRSAFHLFIALISVSVLSALAIWRTKDSQLITDSGLLSIPHFPAAAAALPAEQIYLAAPALLFILYCAFHFHLQRLCNATLELPATFPDGSTLGQNAPRVVAALLRTHFRWISRDEPGTIPVEKILSLLLAYGVAPLVLLLFWARYLTLQDLHGTTLQALLAAAATAMSLYAVTRIGRPQEKWGVEEKRVGQFASKLALKLKSLNMAAFTGGLCVFLLLLSFGTIKGIPREKSLAPQYMSVDIRRWAPSFFWLFGYDPYSKLPEASLSIAPANWTGADDQLPYVKSALLNGRSLRYAEAYGVFLANAHLFRVDFQGAFLSEADLRGADLSQSSLRLADLDRARMRHASLNRADLVGANLARADLRDADLSYASLGRASLVDAQLEGASFYQARLPLASLVRANLEKADLRGANLDGADLERADLQQAYLWSAVLPNSHLRYAQMGGAILIGADLRGADLGGAQLSGTVLNEANLSGTNLAGADLRGDLGLTANQICSAKYHQGALLDDALQTQVDAQCPAH